MATQDKIDIAVAQLNTWIDMGSPRQVSKADSRGLRKAVELLLGAYRDLRQRDANVTTIMIEAIARDVELRKVGAGGTAVCPNCGKTRLVGGTHKGNSSAPCYGAEDAQR